MESAAYLPARIVLRVLIITNRTSTSLSFFAKKKACSLSSLVNSFEHARPLQSRLICEHNCIVLMALTCIQALQ